MATTTTSVTPGAGQAVRIVTNAGVDSGAAQQIMSLGGPDGTLAPFDPDGTIQVSPEATSLFLDDFSGTLSTNFTLGGTSPTSSGGNVTTAEGTTASATSYGRTNEQFLLRAMTFLRIAWIVQLETMAAIANNSRWWGYGQNASTPTATAPVTNGAVFQLDSSAGAFQAAIYSAGTKTVVATLTKPTDGLQHRYEINYRQSVIYWLIDGVTVAQRAFPNLAVATNLYGIFGAANTSTAPSAHTFSLTSFSAGDQGGNNHTISDGAVPNRQATVKPAQLPTPTATDNSLVVQAVPPPGQVVTSTAAAGSAVTATVPAPGTGLRNYITGVTFERYVTAALTGSATPIVTTVSNHNYVTTIQADAAAAFARTEHIRTFFPGAASTAQNTATSFTAPATTSVLWRVTVSYYVAP